MVWLSIRRMGWLFVAPWYSYRDQGVVHLKEANKPLRERKRKETSCLDLKCQWLRRNLLSLGGDYDVVIQMYGTHDCESHGLRGIKKILIIASGLLLYTMISFDFKGPEKFENTYLALKWYYAFRYWEKFEFVTKVKLPVLLSFFPAEEGLEVSRWGEVRREEGGGKWLVRGRGRMG